MLVWMKAENPYGSGQFSYVDHVLRQLDESKLSDSEVCRRAGMAYTTLVRMKSGESSPTMRTLDRIMAVLDREAEMKRAGEGSA